MNSKRTDPYSKTSTFKTPNPNPNQLAEKKSKKKNPSPDRSPNPNRSQSEEKKSKKKKSRTSTENLDPNPKTPTPSTPKKDMSTAPESAASKKRKADEDDAIKILDAVIAFQKENSGANPTPTNMRPLFESLKGRLQADLAGHDQLYNRLRHLRHKYRRAKETTGGAGSSSLYDEKFLERSARAWGGVPQRKPVVTNGNASKKLKPTPTTPAGENGEKIKDHDKDEDEEMEDAAEDSGGESFKCVTHQAREYWAMAGLPEETLEMGLKSMDRNKARALERKWAQHLEGALKVQAKEFEIGKELYLALIAAQKAAAN